jgi:glycosyltransferase involved in cell wall biosynthesis
MDPTAASGAELPHRRASDRITVGYLHLGRGESGVRRYGRILAEAAVRRKDIDVIEADPGDRDAGMSDLRRAARRLNAADVVHIQWKSPDWGGRYLSLPRLEVFLAACERPVVVTLHDVYPREGWRERWADGGAIALRRLSLGTAWIVVHSDEEALRLKGMVPQSKLEVVPHFVEDRPALPDSATAKRGLGLDGCRVVTLLGFMTRRKGHRLVLEALGELPADVMAIFAGAPIEGREARGDELHDYAIELGVADRVRFTGYVPDEELEQVMAATDIALCPFRDMSASGALSTWISTGRPIVSSDLPAFREYDAMSRGSMRMFSPYTAEALAAKLTTTLNAGLGPTDAAVERLRRKLATPRVLERYLDVYRVAAGSR